MPFAVQTRLGADRWDEPDEGYDDCDTLDDVLLRLLAEWAAGDVDLHGTFGFLAGHGQDFGITDDDVDEGTDGALLDRAGETVLDLCVGNEARTREYLIAIGDRVRITETEGEDDDDSSTEGAVDSEEEEE